MNLRQYETAEWNVTGAVQESAPIGVSFPGTFILTKEDGTTQTTEAEGFYRGVGRYTIRYYPKAPGTLTVRFQVPGGDPVQETCQVAPADPGRHGMVQAKGIHLAYEDGTRFFSVGTTIYGMIHQRQTLLETTYRTLADAPFNKIRLCLFPKYYDFNHEEPERFPFARHEDGSFDFATPDDAWWDMLEKNLTRLRQLGIQADLILFHPYDHWGFAAMTKDQCLSYLSYAARRLSSFPNLWWSLANEYDLMDRFDRSWWKDFAALLRRKDPYGHLLSNHQCITEWDFSDPSTTHVCLQSSAVMRTPLYQERYHKPVLFDECAYEGNLPYNWGNITGRELLHRFWTTSVLGGYATHGETFLTKEEAKAWFSGKTGTDPILWWAKGGTLHGEAPQRIAFLRTLMESLPGDPEPDPLDASMDQEKLLEKMQDPARAAEVPEVMRQVARMPKEQFAGFLDGNRLCAGHVGEQVFLQYFAHNCPCIAFLNLPGDREYEIRLVDTWEMTDTLLLRGASGRTLVSLPGKEGMLLLAREHAE
ncbi:MAG: DUF4038 domain-containing protein [Lachnospiraceae bacterium]